MPAASTTARRAAPPTTRNRRLTVHRTFSRTASGTCSATPSATLSAADSTVSSTLRSISSTRSGSVGGSWCPDRRSSSLMLASERWTDGELQLGVRGAGTHTPTHVEPQRTHRQVDPRPEAEHHDGQVRVVRVVGLAVGPIRPLNVPHPGPHIPCIYIGFYPDRPQKGDVHRGRNPQLQVALEHRQPARAALRDGVFVIPADGIHPTDAEAVFQ